VNYGCPINYQDQMSECMCFCLFLMLWKVSVQINDTVIEKISNDDACTKTLNRIKII
jgi:hypothetical protein